jgi:hypothetical protein
MKPRTMKAYRQEAGAIAEDITRSAGVGIGTSATS